MAAHVQSREAAASAAAQEPLHPTKALTEFLVAEVSHHQRSDTNKEKKNPNLVYLKIQGRSKHLGVFVLCLAVRLRVRICVSI